MSYKHNIFTIVPDTGVDRPAAAPPLILKKDLNFSLKFFFFFTGKFCNFVFPGKGRGTVVELSDGRGEED